MEAFNDKFCGWLYSQQEFFSKNEQEDIFDLPQLLGSGDSPSKESVALVQEMCRQFLKLSFIITKHPKELEKLINYLEPAD